ncbi:uncharacterized protein LOC114317966, partial [Camellia sinensis]|uniref:uncharacterized protein LOC114317966 n=1 Tax=Camellia sinensis TaxID=4442 RepID=UPI001035D6A1
MAAQPEEQDQHHQPTTVEQLSDHHHSQKLLHSYLGLSFSLFLSLIPKSSTSFLSTLQSQNRNLCLKLLESEDQLNQLEEKRLLRQIDSGEEEITALRSTVEELEKSEDEMRQNVEKLRRDIEERDREMLNFMATRSEFEEF